MMRSRSRRSNFAAGVGVLGMRVAGSMERILLLGVRAGRVVRHPVGPLERKEA
jgi:hypothetical protein